MDDFPLHRSLVTLNFKDIPGVEKETPAEFVAQMMRFGISLKDITSSVPRGLIVTRFTIKLLLLRLITNSP
jgi:hypothetical protein